MDANQLGRACGDLGFRLMRQVDEKGNRFLSPAGIAAALAAVLAGSRGVTERELSATLGVDESDAPRLAALLEGLSDRRATGPEWDESSHKVVEREFERFVLKFANALFVQRDYSILDTYRSLMIKEFKAEVSDVDFSKAEDAAKEVNAWIADRTEGRIKDVLDPQVIQRDARLALVNAIYFRSQWESQFSEHATRQERFTLVDRSTVKVPMMKQTGTFMHMGDSKAGFEAVSLPYRAMSMVVVLPDKGSFSRVESSLGMDQVDAIAESLSPSLLALQMPKFDFQMHVELGGILAELGARTLFDPDASDLSGITDDPQGLFVSNVIHQANVTVDEKGTEAAAATVVMAVAGSAMMKPPKPKPFVIDRPFLFFIWDEETRTILFLGRVMNPLER